MLAEMLHDMLDKLNEALAARLKMNYSQNERLLSNVPKLDLIPKHKLDWIL